MMEKRNDIWDAIRKGSLERVKSFVEELPELIHAEGVRKLTPLHCSVVHNHIEIAKFLLDKGADRDNSSCGYTPLQLASDRNFEHFVELLSTRH